MGFTAQPPWGSENVKETRSVAEEWRKQGDVRELKRNRRDSLRAGIDRQPAVLAGAGAKE